MRVLSLLLGCYETVVSCCGRGSLPKCCHRSHAIIVKVLLLQYCCRSMIFEVRINYK